MSTTQAAVAVELIKANGDITNLPPLPANPLKGRGYAREPFSFDRRKKADRVKADFYDLLSDAHKCEACTARRGKGYLEYSKFISPEAWALWQVLNGEV